MAIYPLHTFPHKAKGTFKCLLFLDSFSVVHIKKFTNSWPFSRPRRSTDQHPNQCREYDEFHGVSPNPVRDTNAGKS